MEYVLRSQVSQFLECLDQTPPPSASVKNSFGLGLCLDLCSNGRKVDSMIDHIQYLYKFMLGSLAYAVLRCFGMHYYSRS